MQVPTVAQYKKALLAIRPKMHPKHLELLKVNYAAPAHTISVKALSKAVGSNKVWLAYGRLGRLLCDELEFKPTMRANRKPVATQVLADAPAERTEESWEWALRPQVVRALEELEWVNHTEPVNAYVLTWNPTQWPWEEAEYVKEVKATSAGKLFPTEWSCGKTKRIRSGDRLFLMRQGTDRGIIGSGYAASATIQGDHWNGVPGEKALFVKYQSDTLVLSNDRLPVERLLEAKLGVPWNNLYAPGVQVPPESVHRLERLWTSHLVKLGRSLSAEACFPHEATDVEPLSDEIDKVLREIIQRRGQVEFREKLLTAYNGRCPITGCDARSALEAAHIRPYSGASSCKVSNGLLLRADIHTLFDLNLFGIHPSSLKITLLPELQRTCFKDLNGKKLAIPDDPGAHPSKDALRERWKRFKQES